MLNVLFFAALVAYLLATLFQFAGLIFKREKLKRAAFWVGVSGFSLLTAYLVARGVIARRLPLSNQFEFATALAFGVGFFHILLQLRFRQDWASTVALPAAFLVISYAALLPREITEIMPALKSMWFGLHIGSAVFSYAAFLVAGCLGVRYLALARRDAGDAHPEQLDYLAYRLIAFGFLLLTVVILSGCIWAEQAWSSFWTWDPKETWALITWIIYAIYLHQRMRKGWAGKRMAWFAVIAVVCVLFTFIGVNQLLPGLHSYA